MGISYSKGTYVLANCLDDLKRHIFLFLPKASFSLSATYTLTVAALFRVTFLFVTQLANQNSAVLYIFIAFPAFIVKNT